MPNRNPTVNPTIIAGTTLESGTPNTGQVLYSFGGTKNYTSFSGVAPDKLIQLGGGRLEYAQFLPSADFAASGKAVIFYDAHVAAAAGPVFASGHKLLGMLASAVTVSGATAIGDIRMFRTVYTSGLCVYQISGNNGFTVTYTPVISG